MKNNVSFILEMFLKMLKESNLGMSITSDGDLIFNDKITGKKVAVKKKDLIKAYDEI